MADVTSLLSRFLYSRLPLFSGSGAGAIHVNSTAVGNVTTGTDDLQSYSLPASVLGVDGRVLRITAYGRTANTAAAKTLTMEFGSQTIMTQALTTNLAATWRIHTTVVRTGSSTQDIFAELLQLTTIVHKQTLTAGTQTDSAAITIKCTGTATNTDDIIQEGLIVEIVA